MYKKRQTVYFPIGDSMGIVCTLIGRDNHDGERVNLVELPMTRQITALSGKYVKLDGPWWQYVLEPFGREDC